MAILRFLIILLFVIPVQGKQKKVAELTIYTSRKTHLIEPLIQAYSKKTGVKIKHINGKDGALIQKIKQEGNKSPADLLMTVDAGNLSNAASLGLLAPISSTQIESKVPKNYRGLKNEWVGLSLRARTLFYNKNKVKKSDLQSYQGMADKKWKGRLCLRTSRKVYNQSLVAGMIERLGEKKTTEVVSGWVENLAKPVFTSDSQLLEAIDKGICDVGIANTYYLARLVKENKAKNVSVFWPEEKSGGVHVNISGAGILKSSKNKQQATQFLEWLVTDEAQKLFAGLNDEYPVVEGVQLSPILKSWGSFSKDKTPLSSIGGLQKRAVHLMDSVRYR